MRFIPVIIIQVCKIILRWHWMISQPSPNPSQQPPGHSDLLCMTLCMTSGGLGCTRLNMQPNSQSKRWSSHDLTTATHSWLASKETNGMSPFYIKLLIRLYCSLHSANEWHLVIPSLPGTKIILQTLLNCGPVIVEWATEHLRNVRKLSTYSTLETLNFFSICWLLLMVFFFRDFLLLVVHYCYYWN